MNDARPQVSLLCSAVLRATWSWQLPETSLVVRCCCTVTNVDGTSVSSRVIADDDVFVREEPASSRSTPERQALMECDNEHELTQGLP